MTRTPISHLQGETGLKMNLPGINQVTKQDMILTLIFHHLGLKGDVMIVILTCPHQEELVMTAIQTYHRLEELDMIVTLTCHLQEELDMIAIQTCHHHGELQNVTQM